MHALTIAPEDDEGSLAVFSSEEEAETFLRLSRDDEKMGWQSRETTAGELISVLLGPCAKVGWVSLDPLPLLLGRAMLPFVSVTRELFVQELMGEHRKVTRQPVPD